jgi:PAS domain S-box-containing protein
MPTTNSFRLYADAREVSEQLRRRIATEGERGRSAELESALDMIQVLWAELHSKSAELADAHQCFAEFFEYAPEAYLITEPQGEIREANRAACELLGAKAGQLEGTPLIDRVPEAERTAFRERLLAARGHPEGDASAWSGSLHCAQGVERAAFRVRPIKVRRKNAQGLCWLIRAEPSA